MPYSMIEPMRDVLDAGMPSDRVEQDERWSNLLREEIEDAESQLRRCSAARTLTLADLLNLKPGDIIPCDFAGKVTLLAEDVPLFRGSFGLSRGQQAVKIEERVRRTGAPVHEHLKCSKAEDRSMNANAEAAHAAEFDQIQDEGQPAVRRRQSRRHSGCPVTLSMEVGRTRIPIRNLLQLNQGSVVELDRAAGEPLDVFVNGTLIAHGEVVVVNEKFGIRLTDVISPAERIRKLK